MDFTAILSTAGDVLAVACAVVTAASAFCAATPTPDPNTPLGKIYRYVEIAGLLVGKAKDQGLVPDRKPK